MSSACKEVTLRWGSHTRLRLTAQQCAGYTLIELLVVIAIIAILIALLLPAVQSEKVERAEELSGRAAGAGSGMAAGGHDVVSISVPAPGATLDLRYTGRYADPTFSLYDAAGAHIVTHDDSNGSLFPRLTLPLDAGTYSLVVSSCCDGIGHARDHGAELRSTDGTNDHGTYWFGGEGTLDELTDLLDDIGYAA